MNYKNGLWYSAISKAKKRTSKRENIYDERKTLTEIKSYENDTLVRSITIEYDSKNNPVKIQRTFFYPDIFTETEMITYDYKNRYFYIQGFKENDSMQTNQDYLKFFYDKKGRTVKVESVDKAANHNYIYAIYKYDQSGNMTYQENFDKNENSTQILYFKNEYDKKGSLIRKEVYSGDKMIAKTTMDITYW